MSAPTPGERLRMLKGGGLHDKPAIDIVRSDEGVVGGGPFEEFGDLEFEATGLRKERSGVHAKIKITLNGQTIAHTWLNCDRDEDRTRIANSAASKFSTAKERGPAVKLRLDIFCEYLWERWTEANAGHWLSGDGSHRPEWLLEPYILRDAGTILFGPPGGGKSWIAILWCLGLTYGLGLPWRHRATRTLFVNLERSEPSIKWRIARAAQVLGIAQPQLLTLSARGRTLEDVLDSVRATVKREKVELVTVDSLSRSGTGDLTGNEPANRAMDALNSLKCGWTVIAHSPRGDNTHTYGSVMFDAAADLCVRLTSTTADDNEHTLGIALEVTKANDVRKARQEQWALEFDEEGPIQLRAAHEGEFIDLAPVKLSTREAIKAHLLEHGKSSASDIAESTGLDRSRIAHTLRSGTKQGLFVVVDAGKGGRGQKTTYGIAVPGEGS